MHLSTLPSGLSLPAQFGRYRLDSLLSQSELVNVYSGHDLQLNRPVVVKLFQFRPDDSPEVRERFAKGIQAAGTLVHPNLCPIYEVGQVGSGWYVVTPHVEGQRLAEFTHGGKHLARRSAAGLMRNVALALQAAHQRGVIHQHLTPASIIIVGGKDPMVMDLGQVRPFCRTNSQDVRGATAIDVAYLGPEQLSGEATALTPASNVYNVGAILYDLVTGKPPFQGTGITVLQQITTLDPVRPSVHRSDVDPALEGICLQAMAKDPHQRYPDMAALAEVLTRYKKRCSEAVQTPRTGTAFPVGRPVCPPPGTPGTSTPAGYVHAVSQAATGPAMASLQPVPGEAISPPAGASAASTLPEVSAQAVCAAPATTGMPSFQGTPGQTVSPPTGMSGMPSLDVVPGHVSEQQLIGAPGPRPLVWPWVAGLAGFLALAAVGIWLVAFGPGNEQDAGAPPAEPTKVNPDKRADNKPDPPDPVDADFNGVPVPMPKGAVINFNHHYRIDALGNAEFNMQIKFPDGILEEFKKKLTLRLVKGQFQKRGTAKAGTVLRYLLGLEEVSSLGTIKPRFGDDSLELEGNELGWAKRRPGRWVKDLSGDPSLKFSMVQRHERTVTLQAVKEGEDFHYYFTWTVDLPPGANKIDVESKPNRLVYEAKPPSIGSGRAEKEPKPKLEYKPRIMAAMYKLYAGRFSNLWVARSIFTNRSDEMLSNYQVQFQIKGYSEWSHGEESDRVYPGQTVVDDFFPILNPKVLDLTTNTPAQIKVKYVYSLPNGKPVEKELPGKQIQILGINKVVLTDLEIDENSSWYERLKEAPKVIASFITPDDRAIEDLVAMIRKEIGSADSQTNEGAQKFMKALYDLFHANIVLGGRKDLRYGREVLKAHSGTRINLAILYASVAEAHGLDVSIILAPGHEFPAVLLPPRNNGDDRKLMCVDTALACRGDQSLPFEKAVESANKTYNEELPQGRLMVVNVGKWRSFGVSPPELPAPGKDPLKQWNILPPGNNGLALANSPVVGCWDLDLPNRAKPDYELAYFHGNGKFVMWARDDKSKIFEGKYEYLEGKGSITLVLKSQGGTRKWDVEWNGDFTRFLVWTKDEQKKKRLECRVTRRPIKATINNLELREDIEKNRQKGMELRFGVEFKNAPGLPCQVRIAFTEGGNPLEGKRPFENKDGFLVMETITPECTKRPGFAYLKDVTYFVPYDKIGLKPGKHEIKYQVKIWCKRDDRDVLDNEIAGEVTIR